MEFDSDESFEEEFYSDEIGVKQSFYPSKNKILILILLGIIFIVFIEKLSISIFLFLIPSYLLLILIWIIIHLLLIRYLIYEIIFLGKNKFISFFLQKYYGKFRAKSFIISLDHFKNRIDRIIQSNNNGIENEEDLYNPDNSKSKVSSKYVEIYLKIKEIYGSLNSFETDFLNKLLTLKSCIENSSLQDNFKKYSKKEKIILSKNDLNDYENIKNEVNNVQQALNEFRGEMEIEFNFKSIYNYLKNYFYNDILSSKKYLRISSLIKNPNSEQIKVITKDNLELDCLLIFSNNKEGEGGNPAIKKNLVIICGPNLTPFESFINSWDIESLYLCNDIDVFFWNYRGYGFSEGSSNFNNVCEDILFIYDYIVQNYRYNKIAVHGLSIGGIPSCYLASKRNVNLIIADRTFGTAQEFIESFISKSLNKIIYYLAKILFIPLINNTKNFIGAECKKIILSDPSDTTIIDNVSLKTSISKKLIYELFNEISPELNIRNIKAKNILDYALEPDQLKEIYNAFKYTINFLRNNYRVAYFDKEDYEFEKKNLKKPNDLNDDKQEILNEDKILDNLEKNIVPGENLKEISNIFYRYIYHLYYDFNSAGNYLVNLVGKMNTPTHFNNFFNNLFIYGSEDFSQLQYSLCSINSVDEMLNNFIEESQSFLHTPKIKQFSDYNIYKNFSFFVECIKSFKTFILGLHLENIDNGFSELKGKLIPLNCGHIAFYNERELETLRYLLNKYLNENDADNNPEK